ncbi:hypothetical protein [Dactylosporangium sp. NPDC005555]|uniref:hypothetical protein n=1 Tax=Dactylosporangium sp. NPDC005555 TaxID=3154889 RepID=UPI0033BF4DA0
MSAVVRFCELLSSPWPVRRLRMMPLSGAAVRFLTLEATDPQAWRDGPWPHSPWSLKDAVLQTFTALGAPPRSAAALRELIVGAVGRPQRCKDHRYWELARTLDNASLRARLAADGQERARFVLWLLEHPEHRAGSRGWWQWLRTEGRPLPEHLARLDIAAIRRPADAAAALTGVPVPDVARILESIEFGPAIQIAARLAPADAVGALAMMDPRRAVQTLHRVPRPAATTILRHLPPGTALAAMLTRDGQARASARQV